ncbi:hypothetical protein E2493_13670 [Sphingomonas parva]|uniref:Uncharacterized protein n=1 Tax=Sphingomonas parva TaxID=2555898 RepID=A0A4Y8ZQY7_9SPHN|nr:hypothetical protein [Sphingomonas parva]TFI57692.1 hypothetical protein E2493_13670 [Sphingomonas parva]
MRSAALLLLLACLATQAAAAPRGKPKDPPPLVRTPSPPLIITTTPPPAVRPPSPPAESDRTRDPQVVAAYEDWTVGHADPYVFAYTENASHSEFGLICRDGCIFYLDVQLACEDGHAYPAMMNSRNGSDTFDLQCILVDGSPLLTAGPTDTLVGAIKSGGEIGFAVPLESGRFNVARFSLAGGVEALGRARALSDARRDEDETAPRDFTI